MKALMHVLGASVALFAAGCAGLGGDLPEPQRAAAPLRTAVTGTLTSAVSELLERGQLEEAGRLAAKGLELDPEHAALNYYARMIEAAKLKQAERLRVIYPLLPLPEARLPRM